MDPNSYLKRQNFIPYATSVICKNRRGVDTIPLVAYSRVVFSYILLFIVKFVI